MGIEESLTFLKVNRGLMADPALVAEFNKAKWVWYYDQEHKTFTKCSVEKEDGEKVSIKTPTGNVVSVNKDETDRVNPPKFDKIEDMAELTYLNEPAVLHNLEQRYYSNMIYTYSGLFCVVVNPYKQLPIYTDAVIGMYKGKRRTETPPHIFSIADTAFRDMLAERENQSILVTGESGAGKTENTKKVIQYLASIATGSSATQGQLEKQLLQANPILEAFANAKTIRNNNSSRFGKFIRIEFDNQGFISGGRINHYLLEKSRAIRQQEDERNFHIFYYILNEAPKDLRTKLHLDQPVGSYRFMTKGDIQVAGLDDKRDYKDMMTAMETMGLTGEEQMSTFKMVAAVIHFGQIDFKKDRSGEQATLPSNVDAQKLCDCLGIDVAKFTAAILKPKLKVGRELVAKAQNVEQCFSACEALAKAIYERLFAWIVSRINKSLGVKVGAPNFIGILDIAGFEIFKVNSFEQLCINFTNEKMQQFFNHHMFILEQEEYAREGIEWKFVDFGHDLEPTIQLIEKQLGVLSILDEECLFPKATDKSFVEKILAHHGKGGSTPSDKLVEVSFKSNADFQIVHYAGNVEYTAANWLIKNKDPLNDNVTALLGQSNSEFVRFIWSDQFSRGRNNKGSFRFVGSLYREQLEQLMTTLRNTTPNFVRCIIPNHQKKAGVIDHALVLDQLRCNGVIEGIRITRQGFPNRIPFQEFRQRYEVLAPNCIPQGFMDARKAAQKLVEAPELALDAVNYRIGQSKLFFKAGVLGELEELREEKLRDIFVGFQARCRGFLARKQCNRLANKGLACSVIQRNVRKFLILRNWQWWKLFTKVKPLLQVARQEDEMRQKEDELRKAQEKAEAEEGARKALEDERERLKSEKALMEEQLRMEETAASEAEEQRARLALRKGELEDTIAELELRIEEEEDSSLTLRQAKKKLEVDIQDLEDQLEEENASKQKLLEEKAARDAALQQVEDELSAERDSAAKLAKDKKTLEERLADATAGMQDAEDGGVHLRKAKDKLEQTIKELEETIDSQNVKAVELEKAKRKLEANVNDMTEQLNLSSSGGAEQAALAAKRAQEIDGLNTELEDALAKIVRLEKQVRELEAKIEELEEEVESERGRTAKVERARSEVERELESLRNDLEESGNAGAAQSELRAKREAELTKIKQQLEEQTAASEEATVSQRKRFNVELEDVRAELEASKKKATAAEKAKAALQSDNERLDDELQSIRSNLTSTETQRRKAEASLSDMQASNSETQATIASLNEQVAKLEKTLAAAHQSIEELESAKVNSERALKAATDDLAQARDDYESENRSKLGIDSKLKQLTRQLQELQEEIEEKDDSEAALQKQISDLQGALNSEKTKAAAALGSLEEVENGKRKAMRELEEANTDIETLTRDKAAAVKSKNRLQNEIDDLQTEVERARSEVSGIEKKMRSFDKSLADERAKYDEVSADRDAARADLAQTGSKLLNTSSQLEDANDRLSELERSNKQLRLELDDLVSSKDDAGKSVHDLEKAKRALENLLEDQKTELEELDDELHAAEDKAVRLEVQLTAIKAQHQRDLAAASDSTEDSVRNLKKRLAEIEEDLENEQRRSQSATTKLKKSEADLADANAHLDDLSKAKDDALKQARKMSELYKANSRELEDEKSANAEAQQKAKDATRKLASANSRAIEAENLAETAVRDKKSALDQLNEVQEEANVLQGQVNSHNETKRRLENENVRLTEELEEEAASTEEAFEKARRVQMAHDSVSLELASERDNSSKIESAKNSLEKQNRDMKQRLDDIEEATKGKSKAAIAAMEGKMRDLEADIADDEKIIADLKKANRKLDKKYKESAATAEDERQAKETAQAEVQKAASKQKVLKRQVAEAEEDADRFQKAKRKLQVEYDDASEQIESLQREVTSIKARARRGGVGARAVRRGGANTPTEDDEAE